MAVKKLYQHRISELEIQVAKRGAIIQLQLAEHPNILRLLGVVWCSTNAAFAYVMPLCFNGSTLDSVCQGEARLSWSKVKLPLACGIAAGVAFLQEQKPPLIHRDLKPSNILVDLNCPQLCKLADLDLMREASGLDMTDSVGTLLFSSPEMLCVKQYGTSTDTWSFGCLLVCLENQSPTPYPEEPNLATIRSGLLRPSLQPEHPLSHLCADCCEYAPEKRCSMAAAVVCLQEINSSSFPNQ